MTYEPGLAVVGKHSVSSPGKIVGSNFAFLTPYSVYEGSIQERYSRGIIICRE